MFGFSLYTVLITLAILTLVGCGGLAVATGLVRNRHAFVRHDR